MHGLIQRRNEISIIQRLESVPAVALLGARQVGKSTLAEMVIKHFDSAVYLDLERPSDLNKLSEPELFFEQFSGRLICLDEIQRIPDLFPVLRSIIDRVKTNGQFLILGSASRDLIRQSSETLAGRLSYIDITPFQRLEIPAIKPGIHWLRGGYPRSLLAGDDEASFQWRLDYIRTFLERDIPQLGFHIPAASLTRLWQMIAHSHGQVLNASKLADSMGVSSHTIRKYIDILEQTFVLRVLPPYAENLKKRLVKSPKVYIRDSGLLHALLGIEHHEDLFAHPVYGSSYEGFVIENILSCLPRWEASFYRTTNKAEMDLVLKKGLKKIAIEIKSSATPKPTQGFWNALETLKPDHAYLIAPVNEIYQLAQNVTVMSLDQFLNNFTLP